MIEILNKIEEGYNGLALTLSIYEQGNKDLNKDIEMIQRNCLIERNLLSRIKKYFKELKANG